MEMNKLVPMLFDDKQLRIMEAADGDLLFPIPDIANAIGHSRQGIRQIIMRNQDILEGFFDNVTLSKHLRGQGTPNVIALTEEGLYIVLIKIIPSRIKDPEKRKKIIRFQRWVGQTLKAIRQGTLKLVDPRYAPIVYIETGKYLVKDIEWLKRLAGIYYGGKAADVRSFANAEGVDIGTVYNYIRRYRQGGEKGLQRQPPNRPTNQWVSQKQWLRNYAKKYPEIPALDIWHTGWTDYCYDTIKKIVKEARKEL
jgi:prophage antirepressor-like protein